MSLCSQLLLQSRENKAAGDMELSNTRLGMPTVPGKHFSRPAGCPLPVLEPWERPLKLFQENPCSLALQGTG